MAVFDHDRLTTIRFNDVIPELHVRLNTATVKLPGVKTKPAVGLHVAHIVLPVLGRVVRTDAIVAVPARFQTQAVRIVGHILHVRKSLQIDDRIPVRVMIMVASRPGVAVLPIVVKANVAIAQVTQRSGLAVNSAHSLHHAIHDALNERLVDLCSVEVPASPAHGWQFGKAIIIGRSEDWDKEKNNAQHCCRSVCPDLEKP
mmetsp:Transcript_52319/g.152065  ORF Transcript_52319/g.152065 Transcript_52319/m.152065 type:complete len:201 (-) Transcript_52319:12-614(-)